jgi:hypothetical protein
MKPDTRQLLWSLFLLASYIAFAILLLLSPPLDHHPPMNVFLKLISWFTLSAFVTSIYAIFEDK